MCGRVITTSPGAVLADLFGTNPLLGLEPRYNVAPGQPLPVVRLARDAGTRELVALRWGLIPSWATDAKMGYRTINARAETVATTPAFRAAFKARRCLVVVDGFYEWQALARGKQPFYIHRWDRQPLAFAGLWESWHPKDGERLETCTILTTTPNAVMAPIHHRMPVILASESYATWLAEDRNAEPLHRLLAPYPNEWLATTPVSVYVNNPRNDGRECVEPI